MAMPPNPKRPWTARKTTPSGESGAGGGGTLLTGAPAAAAVAAALPRECR